MSSAAETLRVGRVGESSIMPGQSFGPCLVSPGVDNEWTIGTFDGEVWHDDQGFKLAPVLFALLPPLSSLAYLLLG